MGFELAHVWYGGCNPTPTSTQMMSATDLPHAATTSESRPAEDGPGRPWSAPGLVVAFNRDGRSDSIINGRILEHGAGSADWQYQALYEELVAWTARLNEAFFDGKLPPPAVSLLRCRALGTTPWRDGMALKYRININEKYLHRSLAEILRTLLHEMVHQWEEVELGRTAGGSYHTVAFSERAEELGIPVQRRTGRSLGIPPDGPFAKLLASHGVALDGTPVVPLPDQVKEPRLAESRSSLRPWSCGCTRVWASAGTQVVASCQSCGNLFAPACTRQRSRGDR